MPKNNRRLKPFTTQIFGYFTLGLFIFVGFLSSVYLTGISQDTRNQAMVADGIVEVQSVITPSNEINPGQTAQVALQMNTHNVSIVGTQFILTVDTNMGPNAFAPLTAEQITIPTQSGLQAIYKNVVDTGDGTYEIQLSLRPAGNISESLRYSNNSFVTIVQFPITATGTSGQRYFTYDTEYSYILDGENVDVMKSASGFQVNIAPSVSPTVQPPTSTPKVSGLPTTQVTRRPTTSKTPYPTRNPRITKRPAERPPFFYPRSKFRRKVRQYLQNHDQSWWEYFRNR